MEKTMKRFGSAAWSGNLRDGKGTVSTESHALDSYVQRAPEFARSAQPS
jgi:hypothetical protein